MYVAAAILLLAAVSVNAEAQFNPYPQYQYPGFFRSGLAPSPVEAQPDSRLFFGGGNGGGLTLTLATSTSTSIITVSTTCTTSASAISTCSPSGRRRRGLALNNSKGRALFYADDEDEVEEGSIFAPWKYGKS